MKLTDKNVIGLLEKHRLYELDAMLDDYPEEERYGRTDMEMFKNELTYLMERYSDGFRGLHEELNWAKEVLRRTHHGKVIPMWADTLKPMFKPSDITAAKDVVNEYNRTMSMGKRLGIKI